MSLQQQLDELRARVRGIVPPAKQAITDAAIAQWQADGVAAQALKPGTSAPEFELPDAEGAIFRSAAALSRGLLVVKFFRGRWCPYCVADLEAWRDLHQDFRAAGATVVAISPQTARQTGFMVEQHKLPFPVLADAGNIAARRFGVAYQLPLAMQQLYASVFVKLPFINGDDSWELPVPATFVVGRAGRVEWTFADADFTRRADPVEVLDRLRP